MPKRTIGVRDLKARASALLREVEADGVEFVITVRGRPVARLEPIAPGETRRPADGTGGSRGIFAGVLPDATWEDFQELKRIWDPRPFPNGE
jgi:prevent-host-death family protein